MAAFIVGLSAPGGAQVLPGLQQPAPARPTPRQEAAAVGLGQCGGVIDRMVADSVTSPTNTQSSLWRRENPGQHLFQSVIGIRQAGTPSDAMAAVIAAPVTGGGCDGASVRIYPLAVDCVTAETAVRNGGRFLFMLENTRVMLDANNQRLMLLPGANNSCIAVAIDSYFQADLPAG